MIKILTISNVAWSTENAFGNTMTNWFSDMPNVAFSSLYFRSSVPHNPVCHSYYSVGVGDILKHVCHPQLIGRAFHDDQNECKTSEPAQASREQALLHFLHRHRWLKTGVINDWLGLARLWNNRRFQQFVTDENPDIVFAFVTASTRVRQAVDAVLRLVPHCRYVGFIADDIYAQTGRKGKRNIRALIQSASQLYGASEALCAANARQFHVRMTPLYKGCRLPPDSPQARQTSPGILTLTYAGNLYYGREETLIRLIQTIRSHEASHFRVDIYSSTPPSRRLLKLAEGRDDVRLLGSQAYDEIRKALAASDAVLHVESFQERWAKVVRYSYSTKLIDCMESGSILFAIGPAGVASIEAARSIPGAVVADCPDEIPSALQYLRTGDHASMRDLTYRYALAHHSVEQVHQALARDLAAIVESS